MKCRYFVLAFLFVAGLLLQISSAQVVTSEFATVAKAVCSPKPSCAIPQRGIISCPGGGEPSIGLMPPWCPPEGRTKVRDRMLVYQILQTTDDRVSGTVSFRLNMNLDSASFSGPIWGSYLIEVPERGNWEGTWQGTAHSGSFWTYKLVLFGSGEFDGLKIKADGTWKAGEGDMLNGTIKGPSDEGDPEAVP